MKKKLLEESTFGRWAALAGTKKFLKEGKSPFADKEESKDETETLEEGEGMSDYGSKENLRHKKGKIPGQLEAHSDQLSEMADPLADAEEEDPMGGTESPLEPEPAMPPEAEAPEMGGDASAAISPEQAQAIIALADSLKALGLGGAPDLGGLDADGEADGFPAPEADGEELPMPGEEEAPEDLLEGKHISLVSNKDIINETVKRVAARLLKHKIRS